MGDIQADRGGAACHHTLRTQERQRIWIRVFPDKSVTARAAETRMGSGKGPVDHWVAVVRPGRILFEMAGVEDAEAREALSLASAKLPMGTKIVTRYEV